MITEPVSERIIRFAFEYAKTNGKKRVTVITKLNVIKTTKGRSDRATESAFSDYVMA